MVAMVARYMKVCMSIPSLLHLLGHGIWVFYEVHWWLFLAFFSTSSSHPPLPHLPSCAESSGFAFACSTPSCWWFFLWLLLWWKWWWHCQTFAESCLHVSTHRALNMQGWLKLTTFSSHTLVGRSSIQGKGQKRQLFAINWDVNLDLAQWRTTSVQHARRIYKTAKALQTYFLQEWSQSSSLNRCKTEKSVPYYKGMLFHILHTVLLLLLYIHLKMLCWCCKLGSACAFIISMERLAFLKTKKYWEACLSLKENIKQLAFL